jgi:hypothetical protein
MRVCESVLACIHLVVVSDCGSIYRVCVLPCGASWHMLPKHECVYIDTLHSYPLNTHTHTHYTRTAVELTLTITPLIRGRHKFEVPCFVGQGRDV